MIFGLTTMHESPPRDVCVRALMIYPIALPEAELTRYPCDTLPACLLSFSVNQLSLFSTRTTTRLPPYLHSTSRVAYWLVSAYFTTALVAISLRRITQRSDMCEAYYRPDRT